MFFPTTNRRDLLAPESLAVHPGSSGFSVEILGCSESFPLRLRWCMVISWGLLHSTISSSALEMDGANLSKTLFNSTRWLMMSGEEINGFCAVDRADYPNQNRFQGFQSSLNDIAVK